MCAAMFETNGCNTLFQFNEYWQLLRFALTLEAKSIIKGWV